jgi:hypothetical protein
VTDTREAIVALAEIVADVCARMDLPLSREVARQAAMRMRLAEPDVPTGEVWNRDDPRSAFVAGAKWWEFTRSGATMWPSDRDKAGDEAEKRYPAAPTDRTKLELDAYNRGHADGLAAARRLNEPAAPTDSRFAGDCPKCGQSLGADPEVRRRGSCDRCEVARLQEAIKRESHTHQYWEDGLSKGDCYCQTCEIAREWR